MGSICCSERESDQMTDIRRQPTQAQKKEAEKKILSFKDFKGFKKISELVDTSGVDEENLEFGLIELRYDILQELGAGSFGTVMKGLHKQANFECAIKIIEVSQFLVTP